MGREGFESSTLGLRVCSDELANCGKAKAPAKTVFYSCYKLSQTTPPKARSRGTHIGRPWAYVTPFAGLVRRPSATGITIGCGQGRGRALSATCVRRAPLPLPRRTHPGRFLCTFPLCRK